MNTITSTRRSCRIRRSRHSHVGDSRAGDLRIGGDGRCRSRIDATPAKTDLKSASTAKKRPTMRDFHLRSLRHFRHEIPAAALTLLIACCGPATAAPPPIGPPGPTAPVQELPVRLFVSNPMLKEIERVVVNANATAAQHQGVRAKLKVESFRAFGPALGATTFTDRPNQRYVAIPYRVEYKVYDVEKRRPDWIPGAVPTWIPTAVTRRLSQSITVQIFCDRWETGKGSLKSVVSIDRPYMAPEQGAVERAVDFFLMGHLTSFIDGQVRQRINANPITTTSSLNRDCNALGASAGVVGDPTDDLVRYSYRPASLPPVTGLNQVKLTLQNVKRLAARDISGQSLHAASESPTLEVFANQHSTVIQLPALLEGQKTAVSAPALVVPKAGLTALTVLMNIRYPTLPQADPQRGVKPIQKFVDAYEVTIRIESGNLPVAQSQARQ